MSWLPKWTIASIHKLKICCVLIFLYHLQLVCIMLLTIYFYIILLDYFINEWNKFTGQAPKFTLGFRKMWNIFGTRTDFLLSFTQVLFILHFGKHYLKKNSLFFHLFTVLWVYPLRLPTPQMSVMKFHEEGVYRTVVIFIQKSRFNPLKIDNLDTSAWNG